MLSNFLLWAKFFIGQKLTLSGKIKGAAKMSNFQLQKWQKSLKLSNRAQNSEQKSVLERSPNSSSSWDISVQTWKKVLIQQILQTLNANISSCVWDGGTTQYNFLLRILSSIRWSERFLLFLMSKIWNFHHPFEFAWEGQF